MGFLISHQISTIILQNKTYLPFVDVVLKVPELAGRTGIRSQLVCLPLHGPFHGNTGTTWTFYTLARWQPGLEYYLAGEQI